MKKPALRKLALRVLLFGGVGVAAWLAQAESGSPTRTVAPAGKSANKEADKPAAKPGAAKPGSTSAHRRAREGEQLVDALGKFTRQGERLQFETVNGPSYVALENLVLDRVADALKKTDEQATWQVRATITEFAGKNFVLIHQAVRKSTPLQLGAGP